MWGLYTGCCICLNKPEHPLIMSQYAWIRMFVEVGHFDKDFVKNIKEGVPAEKHFGDFSPRYT